MRLQYLVYFFKFVRRDQITVARGAIIMARLRTQAAIHAAVSHKLDLSVEIFFHGPTDLLYGTSRFSSSGTLWFYGRIVSLKISIVWIHHLQVFLWQPPQVVGPVSYLLLLIISRWQSVQLP